MIANADRPGYVSGRHYSTYVEEVKALKRAGRLDRASSLLGVLLAASEAEADAANSRPGRSVTAWSYPAPWYYEHLAIVHRKRKDPEAERVTLERYVKAFGTRADETIVRRLDQLRSRLA